MNKGLLAGGPQRSDDDVPMVERVRTQSSRLLLPHTLDLPAEDSVLRPRLSAGIIEGFTEKSNRNVLKIDLIKRESVAQGVPEEKLEKAVAEKVKKSKEIDITEHLKDESELARDFNTNCEQGLSNDEAARRLLTDGPNSLTPPKAIPWFIMLARHLCEKFALLLWVGSILSFIAYVINPNIQDNLILGIALAAVVVVTGIFSWYQERKSVKILEGFKKFLPSISNVVREGKLAQIPAESIVAGDIVQVRSGEKLPADIRVLQSVGFKVDNSSLTGEPDPLLRRTDISREANPLEANNLAFFGTLGVEGRATGIVIRTGDRTVIGQIAKEVSQERNEPTPLAIELAYFIKIITLVAVFLGFGFLTFGIIKGANTVIANIVFAIGIIVANVPEGLLATVTVALTLTAKSMARRNVLVKMLDGVETLGSTTCIASDKTGTLTQNKMTVAHVVYDDHIHIATSALGETNFDHEAPGFKPLQLIASLCNKAVFINTPENMVKDIAQRDCDGDAGEKAMLKFFERIASVELLAKSYPELCGIPFNSANKFQVSVHRQDSWDQPRLLVFKGAPEIVYKRCSDVMLEGKSRPKTAQDETAFQKNLKALMGNGERVLALAMRELDPATYPRDFVYNTDNNEVNFPLDGLTFAGLVSLVDPPRQAVPNAVKLCQSAGIKVIMVTGDHPETAEAIARCVNIITGKTRKDIARELKLARPEDVDQFDKRITSRVITGQELAEMDELSLSRALDFKELVFARTSPMQKLQIVQAMQGKVTFERVYGKDGLLIEGAPPVKCKNIIAVTGDGVNDSPALKQADIGIAMGIAGSDVAKEAADMILLDDDFSSIVQGVEEGRKIFDNLKKSIAYTLTSNIPEIVPFLMFMIFQIPLAIETLLILCIDLGTDMLPAISFAYEEKEADIMCKPPRDARKDRLVTPQLIFWSYGTIGIYQALTGFIVFFWTFNLYGFPTEMLWGINEAFNPELTRYVNGSFVITHTDGVATSIFAPLPCTQEPELCYQTEEAFRYAQTAYFVNIVICQVFTGLSAKTRLLSIFQHGVRNMMLNFGIATELFLVALLCYLPGARVLNTRPIPFVCWLWIFPFAAFILVYDEFRKCLLRRDTKRTSWFTRLNYY